MQQIILIVSTLVGLNNIYAHENITITESFGNVEVIFNTGYYYEEINKALIIGQYVEKLSKEMDFNNKITLFFKHNIGNYKESYYMLNNGLANKYSGEIYLDMKDREFQILDILKIIEYSINHLDNINNIDGFVLIKENKNKKSKIIESVLKKPIYRPTIIRNLNIANNGISYFYKNGKFHVYRIENEVEKILFSFKNIYQIGEIDEYSFLFFDSKESFYYITSNRLKKPSQRMYIENALKQILPYRICNLSNQVVSITFPEFRSANEERVSLFNHYTETLIQDISNLY